VASWWLLLVALISLVDHGQASTCFSDMPTLKQAVEARTDFTTVETYRLCANTVYDMSAPLAYLTLRSNMNLICGDNGASSDRYERLVDKSTIFSWIVVVES
jgi:hypothetical protein